MKNIGLKYGLLGGVTVVFYFLLLYFIRKELFLNPWLYWGSLLVYLAFMYQAAREDAAQHGAQRDFRAIVRMPFTVFILINLAFWLFYYALHLADKSLVVMEFDGKIQYLQTQLNAVTDPVQRIDLNKQIADMQQAQRDPVQPLGPVLAQMALGALGGFGLAAIIAALIRSKDPA